MSTLDNQVTDKRPASYHHGNLRQALLDEGLSLLESAENADISLRELARRVGVTANATYRHFANKDALLMAMEAEGFRRLAARQAQVMQKQQGDPAQAFLHSGHAYIAFARGNPALFRLMFGRFTTGERNEELEQSGQLAFDGLLQGVAASLGTPIDSDKTLLAAIHAWGLVHGLSHLALDGQFDGFADDGFGLAEKALLEGFANTASTRG